MKGQQLFEWRQALDLSPTGAGMLLGISREHVYKIERGDSPVTPTLELLIGMYRKYGVPEAT